ncbi:MAG: DUF996 domain-containing protein [Nitrososphaerales archaeon]
MSLSQAKTLGEVGSILVFIPILNIVGYILLLISINDVANSVQDRSIFTNTLIAVVLQIAGVVVGFSIIFAGVATGVMTSGLSAAAGAITGFAAIWICFVIAAYFLKKSYDGISSKLGVSRFGTAGLLFLIGSALIIVLVGFIVIFVAFIFQAIAFFSIPDQPGTTQSSYATPAWTAPPSPAPVTAVPISGTPQKYCPGCGSPIDAAARFCRNCGRTL